MSCPVTRHAIVTLASQPSRPLGTTGQRPPAPVMPEGMHTHDAGALATLSGERCPPRFKQPGTRGLAWN